MLTQRAAMISLNEVHLQRGGKILLQNASMLVHAGQRVGVIGANGCGKQHTRVQPSVRTPITIKYHKGYTP